MKLVTSYCFNILRIKKAWKRIESINTMLLPCLSYDFYSALVISFYLDIHKCLHRKIIYYHIKDSDSQKECIVPLVVNRKKKEIMTLSVFGEQDYEDIISNTKDLFFIKKCIEIIFNKYSNWTIQIEHISTNSLYYYLFGSLDSHTRVGVEIQLPATHSEYTANLSKHQQQNIRTAYNKLVKSNISYHLVQYNCVNPIPYSLWKECHRFCESRYPLNQIFFKRKIKEIRSALYRSLWKCNSSCTYVLFFDDKPVSYMSGFYSSSLTSYYVPSLSINNEYKSLSPGIILIVEVIKKLLKDNIKTLDLLDGDEKYKYVMGGKTHFTYKIKGKQAQFMGCLKDCYQGEIKENDICLT